MFIIHQQIDRFLFNDWFIISKVRTGGYKSEYKNAGV